MSVRIELDSEVPAMLTICMVFNKLRNNFRYLWIPENIADELPRFIDMYRMGLKAEREVDWEMCGANLKESLSGALDFLERKFDVPMDRRNGIDSFVG